MLQLQIAQIGDVDSMFAAFGRRRFGGVQVHCWGHFTVNHSLSAGHSVTGGR